MQSIPVFYELCLIVDWLSKKTSLSVFEYATLEEAYLTLYNRKCLIDDENKTRRKLDEEEFEIELKKRCAKYEIK